MPNQSYALLRPGGGEILRFLDDSQLIIKDASDSSEGALAHYEYIAKPAAKGSPQHIHGGHDETFYVVEGEFEFTLGSQALTAGPGSFLLVKRGQPHGFRNIGKSPGRIVGTFAQRFTQYFRELAQIIARTGAPPSMKDWVQLYAKYDTRFYEMH